MAEGNGKTEMTTEGLDLKAMVNVLIEAVAQLSEELAEVKDINVELLEKVNNLSLEGDGYGIED